VKICFRPRRVFEHLRKPLEWVDSFDKRFDNDSAAAHFDD